MRFLLILLLAAGTVAGFTHGVRSLRGGHHACGCPAASAPGAPAPTPPNGGPGPG